jgi:hypothetical protein
VHTEEEPILAYDDVLHLIDSLEQGDLERKCSPHDLERVNRFFINLATQGTTAEDEAALQNDIQELLSDEDDNSFQYSIALLQKGEFSGIPAVCQDQWEVVLCKSWFHKKWDKIKHFVHKHKKEIIIGTIVVVAVVVITSVVIAASAGAAAAAGTAASEGDKEKPKAADPTPVAAAADPIIAEPIAELKETLATYAKDQPENTLGEDIRQVGSHMVHKVFDEVAEYVSVVPRLLEEVKEVAEHVAPRNPEETRATPVENYEHLVASGHGIIDQAFGTNLAEAFTPEHKAQAEELRSELGLPSFTNAVLPPPVFTPKILTAVEYHKVQKSLLRYPNRRNLTEAEARTVIEGYGIRTFPRPEGIPENWRVEFSDGGCGIKYRHPENNHIQVRVMPGKPHSPNPCQQKPYVIQMKDGKALDKYGNLVDPGSPEAHIALEEFIYRE